MANGTTLTASEILDAFEGPIEAVETPRLYQLGIFLVAIGMLLLPIVYIAMMSTSR